MELTDKISLTLELQQWNLVVSLLAEAPYKISAPLIVTMQAQFHEAQAAAGLPTNSNGFDKHPVN
jgi:hypothetical protein